MNREHSPNVAQFLAEPGVILQQEEVSSVPVVQMHDVGTFFLRRDPHRTGGAEERELARVGCKWPGCAIVMVDAPGLGRREDRMMHEHGTYIAAHFVKFGLVLIAAEKDLAAIDQRGAG